MDQGQQRNLSWPEAPMPAQWPTQPITEWVTEVFPIPTSGVSLSLLVYYAQTYINI
jgi:hypothetical protein